MSEAERLRLELANLDDTLSRLDEADPARTLLLGNRKEVVEELAELGLIEDGIRHIT